MWRKKKPWDTKVWLDFRSLPLKNVPMLLCEISDNKLPLPRLENLRLPSKQATLQTIDTRKILVSLNCLEHAYRSREFSILASDLDKEWDVYASWCPCKLVSSCHVSSKKEEISSFFEEKKKKIYYIIILK